MLTFDCRREDGTCRTERATSAKILTGDRTPWPMMVVKEKGPFYRTLTPFGKPCLDRIDMAKRSKTASRTTPSRGTAAARQDSRRKFVVFASLVGALTGTSALLLALAPASLTPDAAKSLLAVGTPQSLDALLDTPIPLQSGRWNSVYIHQSRTTGGSATTLSGSKDGLADHFVICNGKGGADGEVQISQRWTQQSPAGVTAGLDRIEEDCISICVIGDFNHAAPTAAQQQRLSELVSTLQHSLRISSKNLILIPDAPDAAGIGRSFPMASFQSRLVRSAK